MHKQRFFAAAQNDNFKKMQCFDALRLKPIAIFVYHCHTKLISLPHRQTSDMHATHLFDGIIPKQVGDDGISITCY